MIRKARTSDIDSIACIYEKIHDKIQEGQLSVGWIRDVYPTADTVRMALERGDIFVFENDGKVLASAIINQIQVPEYADGNWEYTAPDDKIMVLHTLTVDPDAAKAGIGSQFVNFYEEYAREHACTLLRMDTNKINTVARKFYAKLGYHEAGIVPCVFNGIPDVGLVLLEKLL